MPNNIYVKPTVTLLSDVGLGTAALAAATCYDSFHKSENEIIKNKELDRLDKIESARILNDLSWVHQHGSIIEHVTLAYYVQRVSRGVLQEQARHRMQSISVKSTRYTLYIIINAFIALYKYYVVGLQNNLAIYFLSKIMLENKILVTDDIRVIELEAESVWKKMLFLVNTTPDFFSKVLTKDGIDTYNNHRVSKLNLKRVDKLFTELQTSSLEKAKRNAGDAVKGLIVSDLFATDMVITFNLRSLKNYFFLRDAGSAFPMIKDLAKEMIKATPEKYLRLSHKKYKTTKDN